MRGIRAGIGQLLQVLPAGARRFLIIYIIINVALALIDVASLAILALLMSGMLAGGTLALPVVGVIEPGDFMPLLGLTVGLVVIKALASLATQWWSTRKLASYELDIGAQLFNAYLRAPWIERLKRSTAELVRLADVGIANTISGFLIPVMNLPTLLVTGVMMLVVLAVAQPVVAGIAIVYLGIVAGLLYLWVSRKSMQAGRVNRDYSMKVARLMTEMVGSLKEITLRNKFTEVADVVQTARKRTTTARANLAFLGGVPKHIIDAGLMGGIILVGGVSYWLGGSDQMIQAVALFGVAGFRIIPSLTGFQTVITQTSANLPHLNAVMRDIDAAQGYLRDAEQVGHDPLPKVVQELSVSDVSFTYPTGTQPAVSGVSFTVPMGSTVALVGASGSGKSTLVDILLGLLIPQEGQITLDGRELVDVLAGWRSKVGYVPQDVSLFDGTIAQNVALTWGEEFDRAKVEQCLRQAQLWDAISGRPGGMDAPIGERGLALSGGQRQRLGIARALYADPLILVLDEATSALDTETESRVTAALAALAGQVTVVSVAHRLATIRHSDQILFMRQGELVARGTFAQLLEQVPDFEVQARLAGLV